MTAGEGARGRVVDLGFRVLTALNMGAAIAILLYFVSSAWRSMP